PQGLLQRRRSVLLDDEPAFLDQRIAHGVLERGRVHLDFVAAAALGRVLMTLAAAGRVEQRAEARCGGEDTVKHDLALREAIPLRAVQAAERIAGFDRPLAAGREQHERHGHAAAPRRHGARLFSSIRSTTRPVAVMRQSARTTSPGCRSPNRMAAPSPNTAVAACVRMCTSRSASPTPVMMSTAPAFTACTVPW